jgi:hypothetical protein
MLLTPASTYASSMLSPNQQQNLWQILNGSTEYYTGSSGQTGSGSGTCGTTPTAPVAPGSGLPVGAAFPDLNPASMATAINTWITEQNPNSTLSGLGSTIVASAKNSNVNPFLIVAIAKEETSLADPTSYNVKYANNPFSREAIPSQPNYPGAGVNAGTLWYKWSSVEASVDYTAPENQNAVGGGDMATYLRDQYGAEIDSNNLTALMEAYAPPSQNDTAQYIANLQSWVNSLISLTSDGGTVPAGSGSSGCTVSVNCNQQSGSVTSSLSSVRQSVVCIAQQELTTWEAQPGYPWNGTNSYSETGYLKYSQGRTEEWCADFASWVYNQTGYPLQPDPNWNISYVPNIQSTSEQNQNFHWHDLTNPSDPDYDPNYAPKPGDLAIHGADHVNIVVSISGRTITLIGGDQGNGPYPGGSIVSTQIATSPTGGGITGYVSPD